ncbi:MAG: phosphopantetheine-binding protein [Roseburia sp.]|nr:phosphopantetheine-binding protein [Roseburia sp.]
MDKEEFRSRMYEIFEETGIAVRERYDLEADSLQYVILISTIEETFDIELPDEFLIFSAVQNTELFIDSVYELFTK